MAFAHSGGTDANGCHAGSQPYHCHNGSGSSSGSVDSGILVGLGVAVALGWAWWHFCLRDKPRDLLGLDDAEAKYQNTTFLIRPLNQSGGVSFGLKHEF